MFDQWVDGQPWWMTLLLVPVIVLAAVVGPGSCATRCCLSS